jgi:hypothetical protein
MKDKTGFSTLIFIRALLLTTLLAGSLNALGGIILVAIGLPVPLLANRWLKTS